MARYLGATLVVPDIRGSKPGDERLVANAQLKPRFSLMTFSVLLVLDFRRSKVVTMY